MVQGATVHCGGKGEAAEVGVSWGAGSLQFDFLTSLWIKKHRTNFLQLGFPTPTKISTTSHNSTTREVPSVHTQEPMEDI